MVYRLWHLKQTLNPTSFKELWDSMLSTCISVTSAWQGVDGHKISAKTDADRFLNAHNLTQSRCTPSDILWCSCCRICDFMFLCNPVRVVFVFDCIDWDVWTFKTPPIFSRGWTGGGSVRGAAGGEGQSWWCPSSDPGQWVDTQTDWNLALFSDPLAESGWFGESLYFWSLGSRYQTLNMIHNILTHT